MEKQAEDMVRRQHHRTPAHPQRQRSARQPLQCEYVDAGWDYAEDSEGDWGSEEEADAEPSASEESDGEGGRRQVLDLMPGCFRCGFSKVKTLPYLFAWQLFEQLLLAHNFFLL